MKIQIKTETLRQISELLSQQSTGVELANLIDAHLAESHQYLVETVNDYLADDISKEDLASAVATEQKVVLSLSYPEKLES